jgi:hypothetical protein
MTSLQPTPSRSFFRRIPVWAVAVVAALLGLLLIGAGLLITGRDDKVAAPPAPTCTPSPPAPSATVPPTAAVDVNVYNATERAGLARDTADALEDRGFKAGAVANDPKKAKIAGTAVIRHVADAEDDARWVAAQVDGATLTVVPASGRTGADVDLVIGAGFTQLAPEPAALAAFAASAPQTTC